MQAKSTVKPLRYVVSTVAVVIMAGVMILPFVLGANGPLAHRQPGMSIKREKALAAMQTKLSPRSGVADIESLKARIKADVERLASEGRVAGSPGAAKAAAYVIERFKKAGLTRVVEQKFKVTMPITEKSAFNVGGQDIKVYPLRPNLARTCTIGAPDNSITTRVVWGGSGTLAELKGKDLNRSILVLKDSRGMEWLTACSLGPDAVIFIEPEKEGCTCQADSKSNGEVCEKCKLDRNNYEIKRKVLSCVLDIPRFWVPKEDGRKLEAKCLAASKSSERLEGTLTCKVSWRDREVSNVYGMLVGANPEKAGDVSIILSHYDSASLVPDLSPGAEAAASLAATLELADRMALEKPERSVLFVVTGAHYPAMIGERHAMEMLRRPVSETVSELRLIQDTVLGWDSQMVLLAAGQEVSGMRPWQNVLLYVLGALVLGLVVLAAVLLKTSRAVKTLACFFIFAGGMTGIYFLRGFFSRVRKSEKSTVVLNQKQRQDTLDSRHGAYSRLKRSLGKLAAVKPAYSASMIKMVRLRERAEVKPLFLLARINKLLRINNTARGLNASSMVELKKATDEFKPSVDRAMMFEKDICFLLGEMIKAAGSEPAEEIVDDRLELRNQLEIELKGLAEVTGTGRKASRKLFDLLTPCAEQMDEVEERLKVAGLKRVMYIRLAGYLTFAGKLGFDIPKRIKSCFGVDLSSHCDRLAVFFKGTHINQSVNRNEKMLMDTVAAVAEYLSDAGSMEALAQKGWVRPSDKYSYVYNTTISMGARNWKELISRDAGFGAEAFMLGGIPAVTIASFQDGRSLANTPLDLPQAINYDKISRHTEIMCRSLQGLFQPGSLTLGLYDISSWPGLAACLTGEEVSKWTKVVAGKINSDAYDIIKNLNLETGSASLTDEDKTKFLVGLNKLVLDPQLYASAGTKSLELQGEARRLMESARKGELDQSLFVRLNRLLLEVAIPQLVKLADRERGLYSLESVEQNSSLKRGKMCMRIFGQVIELNPAKSKTLSVTPVPGSVVFCRQEAHQYRNRNILCSAVICTDTIVLTDSYGAYEVFALLGPYNRDWAGGEQRLQAFGLDTVTGNVIMAPDSGPEAKKYKEPWRPVKRVEEEFTLVTFACQTLNIFEIADLRDFESRRSQFTKVTHYKGIVDEIPISYGLSIHGRMGAAAFPEHAMVLFTDRKSMRRRDEKTGKLVESIKPVYLKTTFGNDNLTGYRWPMLGVPLNANAETHTGYGIETKLSGRVTDPDSRQWNDRGEVIRKTGDQSEVRLPLSVVIAQDLYRLDDYRLAVLKKAGVTNSSLQEQHKIGFEALEISIAGKEERDWLKMMVGARSCWGYEARAYPNVMSTVLDVVKGLLFYLFLMLPFAYFMERLFFAFPNINRQLGGVFGMFMVFFGLLYIVHPAFRITSSAPMILLAFITLAMAILVMVMITSRFRRELEAMQQRPGKGRKSADLDRFNAALSAFLLGINNMRRRKVRTLLTMVTLVLLTFSVLSFSSIEGTLGANKRPVNPTNIQNFKPPYQGVLVRSESWLTLDAMAGRILRDEFQDLAGNCLVAPRAYGKRTTIHPVGAPEDFYDCPGVLGVRAQERELTGLGSLTTLKRGRWFTEEEVRSRLPVCLLDEQLMVKLRMDESAVSSVLDLDNPENFKKLPRIVINGEELAVIGVLRADTNNAIVDIDGERIAPVDWDVEGWTRRRGKGAGSEELEFRQYQHVEAFRAPVVTYDWLMSKRKGALLSVAIKPNDPARAPEIAESLLKRIAVPFFLAARENDGEVRTTFMSAANSNDVSGVGSLIVPMLIAALIVLNTMLGSVYEREGEITIYGSLGLAPVHIGSLFIAESAVFAVVSAVIGYMMGQAMSKVVLLLGGAEGMLAGFSLNYSSLSAVFSACFIIGVVMLSAAYPAMRAGQLSVPDVERIWKFPEPVNDQLTFDFPFTVSGDQALGINVHLKNFFEDHANQSVGEFYTADTDFGYIEKHEKYSTFYLESSVWIAPFDFGISQRLRLETYLAEGETNIFETRMVLTRMSGAPEAWLKMNHRFMKSIRKQFLLWRLFSIEERSWHTQQARVLLGEISEEEAARLVAETEAEVKAMADLRASENVANEPQAG
jgi:FtsX-like permease family